LFTYDSSTYKAASDDKENTKKVYLKWVRKEDDKTYIMDDNNTAALYVDLEDEYVTDFEDN